MTQPAISTDPVCGMDVDSNGGKLMSLHHGQTYYFCSIGCKQMFDTDPDKYLSGSYKPSMLGAMMGRVKGLFWSKNG